MRIGIIGHGYVGQAVAYSHNDHELVIRDPKYPTSAKYSDFLDCDAIYVCVPSPPIDPTLENGRCDTSILEQTLKDLLFVIINKQIPIICKTTAPPSVYARLQKEYPCIVHVPEFLTAKNHIKDYLSASYAIIGGDNHWNLEAAMFIQSGTGLSSNEIVLTDIKTAALYKYMMNSYLATKVTFMNEFKQLADAEGVKFDNLISIASHDKRMGKTHNNVPGPDGKYGWGGSCFPKDIAAIITEALDLGLDFDLMQRVETLNNTHRNKK